MSRARIRIWSLAVLALVVSGVVAAQGYQLGPISEWLGPILITGRATIDGDLTVNGDAGVSKNARIGGDVTVLGDAGVGGTVAANGLDLRTVDGSGSCSLAKQGQIRQVTPAISLGFPSAYYCDGFRWRLLAQDTSIFFSTVGIVSGINPGDIFAAAAAVGTEGRILSCSGVIRSPGVGAGTGRLAIRQQLDDGGTTFLCGVDVKCTASENTVIAVQFCTSEDGGTALEFSDYLVSGDQLIFRYDSPSGCTQLPELTGSCQAQVWKASLP